MLGASLLAGACLVALSTQALSGGTASAAVALQVTSSVTPNPVIIGDTATFTVTVRNGGSTAASDVRTVITITPAGSVTVGSLPAGCTVSSQVVTCDTAALGAGGSASFQIPVTVSPSLSDGTNIRLEATARDSAGATGSAQPLIVQAHTRTDVAISKTGPAEANPGGTITYTITVTNHGPSDAVSVTWHDETNGNLTAIDGYPCGNTGLTVSCSVGTLKPGESATYIITLTVRPDVPDGTVIPNCAVVYTGTSPDTNLDNNQSCIETTVTAPGQPTPPPAPPAEPVLDVTKTAPAEIYETGTIAYTITVTNRGTGEATGVRVTDPLDPALDTATLVLPGGCSLAGSTITCEAAALAAGESRTFEIRAEVRPDVPAGTNVINCAAATSGNGRLRIAPSASCGQTHVIAHPSTGPAPVQPLAHGADISVAKSGPARTDLDGDIAYTVTVINHGPAAATDVVVHDPVSESLVTITALPDDCAADSGTITCQAGDLGAGESRAFTFTVRVDRGVGDRTVIENCASAYSQTDDPDIGNNSSCAETIVGVGHPPQATVVIAKNGPATIRPGGTLAYSVKVTNRGPDAADGVVVRDPLDEPLITAAELPDGCVLEAATAICTVGTLAAGESRTFPFTATVAPGTAQGTRIDNCAAVRSSVTLLLGDAQFSCTEADVLGPQEAPSPPFISVTG